MKVIEIKHTKFSFFIFLSQLSTKSSLLHMKNYQGLLVLDVLISEFNVNTEQVGICGKRKKGGC